MPNWEESLMRWDFYRYSRYFSRQNLKFELTVVILKRDIEHRRNSTKSQKHFPKFEISKFFEKITVITNCHELRLTNLKIDRKRRARQEQKESLCDILAARLWPLPQWILFVSLCHRNSRERQSEPILFIHLQQVIFYWFLRVVSKYIYVASFCCATALYMRKTFLLWQSRKIRT